MTTTYPLCLWYHPPQDGRPVGDSTVALYGAALDGPWPHGHVDPLRIVGSQKPDPGVGGGVIPVPPAEQWTFVGIIPTGSGARLLRSDSISGNSCYEIIGREVWLAPGAVA